MTALEGGLTMRADEDPALLGLRMPADWPGASQSRLVRAAGLRWHVQVHGGRGPVILMLHGAGASLHSWAALVPALSANHRVVLVDLPGHGFSDAFGAGAYTLGRTAAAMAALNAELGLAPALIVGHSAGAAIAMQMVLDAHADGTATLPHVAAINPAILPFAGLAGIAFPVLAKFAAGSRLLAGLVASRASSVAQVTRLISGTGSTLDAEGIARYQWLMQRRSHVAAVLSMMAGWQLDALLPALRRLDPAMHFIIAERDCAVPAAPVADVARQLANTELTLLADYGHLLHEEAPAEVAAVLRHRVSLLAGTNE